MSEIPEYDFESPPRCDECAGLCCVIPRISDRDATVLKTVNRVCEHLEPNLSGVSYSCQIYPDRKREGYRICTEYSCFGIGPAITRTLRRYDGILPDGTVIQEGVDLYDAVDRIAEFLRLEQRRLTNGNPKSPLEMSRLEFVRDCALIYQRFIETSELALPNGTPTDAKTLRKWFVQEFRDRFESKFGRFVRTIRENWSSGDSI